MDYVLVPAWMKELHDGQAVDRKTREEALARWKVEQAATRRGGDVEERRDAAFLDGTCSRPGRFGDLPLPVVYLFANNDTIGWMECFAIAEDGEVVASWVCSDRIYMWFDLHDRAAQREKYVAKFPEGYEVRLLPQGILPPQDVLDANEAFYARAEAIAAQEAAEGSQEVPEHDD